MLAGIIQSLAVMVAVVAYYAMDFLLMGRYDQGRRAKGSGRSWDFTIMAMSTAVFIIVQPILLPRLALHIEARWGALLQAVGLLLINPALPTLLLALYAVWDLTRAARQEEQLLSRELPGYTEYMARTPRFLPRLSRPPGGD